MEDKRNDPTLQFQGEASCALETAGETSPPGTLEVVDQSIAQSVQASFVLLGHCCAARPGAPWFSLPGQSFSFGKHRFVFSLQLYLLWLLINWHMCMCLYACSHEYLTPVLTIYGCSLPNLPADSLLIDSTTSSLAANYDLVLVLSQLSALNVMVTSEERVLLC